MTAVVDCVPAACRGCGRPPTGSAPEPRHQVVELPEVRSEVVEHRLHRLDRRCCGLATQGRLHAGAPRGAFGPRLQSVVALLGGAYRLSERQSRALLADLLGLDISTGSVCQSKRQAPEAVAEPVREVYDHIRSAPSAGVNETGWREGRCRAWLWAAVTPEATAFCIAGSRGGDALHAMVGDPVGPVVVSDRFPTSARAPNR